MLNVKMEGKTLICVKDVVVDGEKAFTTGNRNIFLFTEDQTVMLINELGEEHWFTEEEFRKHFVLEDDFFQPWIEEERQRKQSITFRNRLRYKKQVEFAIGDIITVVYRSEIYSNEPLSYTGELIGLEDDGLWVELDSRGEWFSYCDIDDIVVK